MGILVIAPLSYKQQYNIRHYDPNLHIADDEITYSSVKYGILLPMFIVEETECHCDARKATLKVGPGLPVYVAAAGILALGTTYVLNKRHKTK